MSSNTTIVAHAFRLHPNEDLYDRIKQYVTEHGIEAGAIQTCVGSLKQIAIRLADETQSERRVENFEICSLVGTVGLSGLHLHIALSDRTGQMLGGHVLSGCKIYTTAEIVILEYKDLSFERQMDDATGFKELVVIRK